MRILLRLFVGGALLGLAVFAGLLLTDGKEDVALEVDRSLVNAERGELLLGLAGCVNCHTDPKEGAAPLAGGRALKTPFGTFYAPNISSDPNEGVGAWSEEDFVRALRHGRSPEGEHYFPAFPYVAYTLMTDSDMLAVRAAIMARPAADRPNTPHQLGFPFDQRWAMRFWKLLHFDAGAYQVDSNQSEAWNRGAYISEALAHCGECHTPRYPSGGLDRSRWFAGVVDGPEGELAPNITPDPDTGLGQWDNADVAFLLTNGLKIDGDVVGSVMFEVVDNGTAKLQAGDVAAMVEYLKSIPPIPNADAPAAQGF